MPSLDAAGASSAHRPDPFILVLFGATGDLARRKLLPAVYSLFVQGLLSQPFAIVAFARREGNDESFRESARAAIERFGAGPGPSGARWEEFAAKLFYHRANLDSVEGFQSLKTRLAAMDREGGFGGNRLFYLAIPPDHFSDVVAYLDEAGLICPAHDPRCHVWTRVIVEKPFGSDLKSARQLNECVRSAFDETQVFRIDHYLGKETVQNILVTRFANSLYELLWNHTVVNNVQITVAETLGMEGRGAYFDETGIARDVIQNHALQILTLIAMEPPVRMTADSIRDEKVKVLQAMRPFDAESVRANTVRGQYTDGHVVESTGEVEAVGYTREDGVRPHSTTETYAALRLHVDNWRWAGVPFYVRAGKRMKTRTTEVKIELKAIPEVLFGRMSGLNLEPNLLTIRIQPNEGTVLRMCAKEPGATLKIDPVEMHFDYAEEFNKPIPEAYERLILDAILGEAALFARADEVEGAWSLITPIVSTWQESVDPPEPYFAGTWGPRAADQLLRADGREWHNREPSPPRPANHPSIAAPGGHTRNGSASQKSAAQKAASQKSASHQADSHKTASRKESSQKPGDPQSGT